MKLFHPRSRARPVRFFGFVLALLPWFENSASAEIYVRTATAIRVFKDTADGNTAPVRSIEGDLTKLANFWGAGLALDLVHREIFVTSGVANGSAHVLVFPMDASGNVAPIRDITGPATHLSRPWGMAIDTDADELWVASRYELLVFGRGADGNADPLRNIFGFATNLIEAAFLFLDRVHHELFVSNAEFDPYTPSTILVFDSTQAGDVAPSRVIAGDSTGLSPVSGGFPAGLFLDLDGDVLAVADVPYQLLVFGRAAAGDVSPLQVVTGDQTAFDAPFGLTRTTDGEYLTANFGPYAQAILGQASDADGNAAPIRRLSGPATLLDSPEALSSTRAAGCAAGFVASGCIFIDDFEDGDACRWIGNAHAPSC